MLTLNSRPAINLRHHNNSHHSNNSLSKMPGQQQQQQQLHQVNEISSDDDDILPMEESLSYKYIYGDIEFPAENLKSLNDRQYLSDSIVQFYLAYLINGCDKQLAKRVHIFDSMIIESLELVFNDEHKVGPLTKLKSLNRWLTNVDMFQKDFIIFPVCSEQHWFVIVVCYPELVENFEESHYTLYKRFNINNKTNSVTICDDDDEIYDDNNGLAENDLHKLKTPGIFVMDSLSCKAKKYTAIIRDFLDYDWRSKPDKEIKRFSNYDIVDYNPKLPTQTNSYDCGVYILAYVKSFLQNPDNFYRLVKANTPLATDKLACVIKKNLELVNRDSMRTLIRQICESNYK